MCSRYWAEIDTELRRMAFERKVHVRLLISCWRSTSPDMFPFLRSLASLQDSRTKLDIQVVSDKKSACNVYTMWSCTNTTGQSWVSKIRSHSSLHLILHPVLFLLYIFSFCFPIWIRQCESAQNLLSQSDQHYPVVGICEFTYVGESTLLSSVLCIMFPW